MDKWEYIVGVQIYRSREPLEVSVEPREIIDQGTPPENWLNKKGYEGWELVTGIDRGNYLEFYMKRKISPQPPKNHRHEERAISLAKEAEYHFSRNEFDQVLAKLKELQKLTEPANNG